MLADTLRRARRPLTYANVMSTLSVFLVIAGGTALAAGSGSGVLLSVPSRSVSVPAGSTATVNVSCPPNTKILAGGAHFDNYSGTISASTMNFNRAPITWKAAGTNHGSSAQYLHVLGICQYVG
jgi:hypothetical protein